MTNDQTVTQADSRVIGDVKLSRHATYGALKRRVAVLRQNVSDYDAETDKMKRKAEREGGPAARLVVDTTRSPGFHELREHLRRAEAELAAWRPAPKKPKPDVPFSSMVSASIRKLGGGRS